MSDRNQSKAQETIGLPKRIKHGYLHFQIDDYMKQSHGNYYGPGAMCVLKKHLESMLASFHHLILSNAQQSMG